jgi:iron complex transport system substrate-binding protein
LKQLLLFLILGFLFSCKDNKASSSIPYVTSTEATNTFKANTPNGITLKYAEGFTVTTNKSHKILTIKNPWPKSKKDYNYVLISEHKADISLGKDYNYDHIIQTPIKTVVATSTTHIPALELLGVEQTLAGFPGTSYISSKKTRRRIDNGKVRELGKNEGINTEVLLELRPDIVIAFGVDGTNNGMETITKAGIPVIYNGDWVEKSPLAKAEWIKFFGVLYGKEKEADSIFTIIERDYLKAKQIALKAKNRPTVLSGALYKDIWYLPNGTSSEAQFIKDANANYLWSNTTETGSIPLSFEAVFDKAKSTTLWLSPSYYPSYEALEQSNSHYSEFDAFKNKNIYTFANTKGATGGVTYYELGMARPDLVLKDIIKICHPNLLKDYTTTFFKPLKLETRNN